MKLRILPPLVELSSVSSIQKIVGLLLLVIFTSRAAFAQSPERIVTLSPSITEIVFALGRGSSLVGVSSYSDYPEAAKSITSVGGLYDSNLEQILSLKPDLIVAPAEHKLAREKFTFKGIDKILVSQETLAEIDDSIIKIAKALGEDKKGKIIVKNNRERLDLLRNNFKEKELSALVVFGGAESLQSVFISGDKTLYQEILQFLGVSNAYKGNLEFPKLSPEGLVSTAPDLIINLIPEVEGTVVKKKQVIKRWKELPGLSPKLKKNIFILTPEYLVNPGPRYPLIVEDFAKVLRQTRD